MVTQCCCGDQKLVTNPGQVNQLRVENPTGLNQARGAPIFALRLYGAHSCGPRLRGAIVGRLHVGLNWRALVLVRVPG